MEDKAFHDQLKALADGELPAEQRIRLLRELAANQPGALGGALGHVADQQQLRLAVRQAMQAPLEAPLDLRSRIEQLTAAELPQPSASSAAPRPQRGVWPATQRWVPLAAAVLIVAVAGVNVMRMNARSGSMAQIQSLGELQPPSPRAADMAVAVGADLTRVIPKDRLARLAHRHEQCAQKKNQLYSVAAFPQQLELVPAAVSEYLGGNPYPSLDFSMLGYQFHGIGQCRAPGSDSVHLVYRSMPKTGRDSALSLWIQPDQGQLEIPANQLFSLPDEQYPMFIWRDGGDGGMVYYLMGDSLRAMTGAQQMLIASR